MRLTTRLVLGALVLTGITVLIVRWGGATPDIGSIVVALLLGGGIALVAGRSIARPLTHLSVAARAIATGAQPRFPQSPIPEIDELTRALRQTDRELADRFEALVRTQSASSAIVEAMGEGIIAADARSHIVLANRMAREMLGYAAGAALPDLRTLFRVKGARELVASAIDSREGAEREITLGDRFVSLHSQPLEDGGVLLVLRDLTAVRRLEAVRKDFVANVSHELKTPLTSISGYAETLLSDDPDAETRSRFLGIIRTNARRMQVLIDDLLDLSRIESGRWTPRPEPLALADVVEEAWGPLAQRAMQQATTLTTTIGAGAEQMHADPSAMRQVLGNLFDNALRHVGAEGRVEVIATRQGAMVEVLVRDNGSGIPPEHLTRVFERFYRVDASRSREEGGTGLGLAIVRHMIEAHGGRVAAESAPRAGTTIRFTLPTA